MDTLYNYILEGLRHETGTKNDEDAFKNYLVSLQPYVKKLRQSYKENTVAVDYSDPNLQAAYLITYYPPYVEMTYYALEELEKLKTISLYLKHQYEIKVCLFGAGCAPEVVGLISFIERKFPNIKSITIRAYDIYAKTWKISYSFAKKYILPNFLQENHLIFPSYQLNLCQDNALVKYQSIINNSHLFIFQNCLNEIKDNDNFTQTLKFIIQAMPSHSAILFSEQKKYNQNFYLQKYIQNMIEDYNQKTEDEFNEKAFLYNSFNREIRLKIRPPLVVTQNLLIGKPGEPFEKNGSLTPRSQLNCSFFSIYKKYSNEIYLVKNEKNNFEDFEKLISQEKELLINQLKIKFETLDNIIILVKNLQQKTEQLSEEIELIDEKVSLKENNNWQQQAIQLDSQVQSLQENQEKLSKILIDFQAQLKSIEQQQEQNIQQISQVFQNRIDEEIKPISENKSSLYQQQTEEKINEIEKAIPMLVKSEIVNLNKQIHLLRTAIIVSSTVGFLGFLLAIFALLFK